MIRTRWNRLGLANPFCKDSRVNTNSGRRATAKTVLASAVEACFERLEGRRLFSAGDLDLTFGTGGRVVTDVGGPAEDYAQRVALQADGKVVVAGRTRGYDVADDFALARFNADGSLDTSFGGDGKVTTDLSNGSWDYISGLALQSDGKVVVVGQSSATGSDFTVVRYNNDGSLDAGFGSGDGVATADVSAQNTYDTAQSVALQTDGKIVVGGHANTSALGSSFALARFNSDGSLDTSFSDDGRFATDLGGSYNGEQVRSIAIQSDGKIVAGGNTYAQSTINGYSYLDYRFALLRVNVNGTLDSSFSDDGKLVVNFHTANDTYSSYEQLTSIAVGPHGKIIAGGYSQRYNGSYYEQDFALLRVDAAGVLDNSFDGDGMLLHDVSGSSNNYDYLYDLAVQPDGKVVAAGQSQATAGKFTLVRYNANGTLDTGFDSDGKVSTSFSSNSSATAVSIALDAEGGIVAAGHVYKYQGGVDFGVARYSSTGALDAGFGDGGTVTCGFTGPSREESPRVAVQADGKVLVVGQSHSYYGYGNYDFHLLRYNIDGTLDSSFGGDGKVLTDFGGYEQALDVAVQSDGKIVVVGYSSGNIALARYDTDGSLDTSFDADGKLTATFGASAYSSQARRLVIQPDDKIVVGGTAYRYTGSSYEYDFALARFGADGALDSTFNGDGTFTADFNGGASYDHDHLSSIGVSPGGKIVAGGYSQWYNGSSYEYDFALLRVDSAGALDTSLDGDGMLLHDVSGSSSNYDYDHLYDLAVQPDGKIVAAGHSQTTAGNFTLVRYNVNGSVDTGFGSDGKVVTASYVADLALQSDGKIVAAGEAYNSTKGYDFALARYNTDGGLDSSFGGDGKVLTDFASTNYRYDSARSVAIAPDGKIVAAGITHTTSGSYDFALARYEGSSNRAPSAHPGGPYSVREGESLILDASASADLDGDALAYSWDVNGDGVFGDAVGVGPTLTWADLEALGIIDGNATSAYTLAVEVSDGQLATSASATLSVANVAPTVAAGGALTLEGNRAGVGFTRTGSFSDLPADSLSATVDYGDGSGAEPLTLNSDNTFALAHVYTTVDARTVTVSISDDDGGVGTASFLVSFVDKTPPVVGPVQDLVVEATGPDGAVVVYDLPGVQDAVDLNPTVETSPNPGSMFPLGVTAVRISARDEFYNQAHAEFNVTVVDTTAPDLVLPAGLVVEATSPAGAPVNFAHATATDAVSQPVIVYSVGGTTVADGSQLPLGTTIIDVAASDQAGNTSHGSFSVMVRDSTAPQVDAGPDGAAAEGAAFEQSGAFTDAAGVSFIATVDYGDGGGSQVLVLNPDRTFALSHVYADNGTYAVTVSVDDGHGNRGSDTFDMTVANVAPTATIATAGPVNEASMATVTLSAVADDSPVDAQSLRYFFSVTQGERDAASYAAGIAVGSTDFTFGDDGNYIVYARVLDKDGGFSDYETIVNVNNVAPTLSVTGAATSDEGAAYELTLGAIVDPGADTVSQYLIHWGDGQTTTLSAADVLATGGKLSHTYAEGGNGGTARNITVDLTDEDGTHAAAGSTGLTVNNVAPALGTLRTTATQENGIATFSAALIDAGVEDAGWVVIDWGDGSVPQTINYAAGTVSIEVMHQYLDDDADDTYTISATTTDDDGGWTVATTAVTVTNVAPQIMGNAITLTVDPIVVNTGVASASASFIDAGTRDVHTAVWDWGDGTTSAATVTQGSGSGSVADTHSYAAAGTYQVRLTVTDDDTGTVSVLSEGYVVVYDPTAGFVTGGGWIDSPTGAYAADPTLTGRATFGFVSRYQKGATVPTGNTVFQFKAGNLNFSSTSYKWLVVSGSRAQYKGEGTINGAGNYGFMLTVVDGAKTGGPDRFRIKIWDKASDQIVYDNQMGAADDESLSASTAIGGGSILIHS